MPIAENEGGIQMVLPLSLPNDEDLSSTVGEHLNRVSATRKITPHKTIATRTNLITETTSKFKVVFLGDVTVGKTSWISRFLYGSFSEVYQPTIGIDFLSSHIESKGRKIRLQIWDTAGQERFRSLIPSYIRDAAIAFIMFDVTNRATFLNVPDWAGKVREETGDTVVLVLVGNKTDKLGRVVETPEAQELAASLDMLYVEGSAREGENVASAFTLAAGNLTIPDENDTTPQHILKVKLDRLQLESSPTHPAAGSCAC